VEIRLPKNSIGAGYASYNLLSVAFLFVPLLFLHHHAYDPILQVLVQNDIRILEIERVENIIPLTLESMNKKKEKRRTR
jgi:hypothetical protein